MLQAECICFLILNYIPLMKIASSVQNLYPMWLSKPQMKNSINHNLNTCQLFHCFKLFCLISIFIHKNSLCASFDTKKLFEVTVILPLCWLYGPCILEYLWTTLKGLYATLSRGVEKKKTLMINDHQVLPILTFRILVGLEW